MSTDQLQLPLSPGYAGTGRPEAGPRRPSPGQVAALQRVRESKAAVKAQGSVFAGLRWEGTRCLRCGHWCGGRHHPGAMGRCTEPGCYCQMAEVACTCRHTTADHEPFGAWRSTACHLCGCLAFAAAAT